MRPIVAFSGNVSLILDGACSVYTHTAKTSLTRVSSELIFSIEQDLQHEAR